MNRFQKPLSIVLLLLAGVVVGRYSASPAVIQPATDQEALEVSPFWETWNILHESFIGTLDTKELLYGAVAGMVRASGDPYTAFSDPKETKDFKDTLKGSFSGIGAEMGIKKGLIVVIAPLPGSPAEEAGVQSGDIVVAVDEKDITEDMTLDDVVSMIRGPKGKTVKLTVLHPEAKETTEISIVRDDIALESVKKEYIGDIAHISILNFNGDTSEKFIQAAKEAKQRKVQGVVLDVRGNPGGYLDSAVDIASEFLDPGKTIVIEKGKKEITHKSRGIGTLKGVRVVVLINQSSASASEILAGALQDNLLAEVVGIKSFGKGSVQEVIDLSDGSSLRVTIAKWFTPNGRSIDEHGIDPTIVLEDDSETADTDEQLERALTEVRKK